jgi:iron complex transport system permease protein
LAIFLLNVGNGSADISVSDIIRIARGNAGQSETNYLIIQRIRLPRALAGMCGGAALAIAGFLLQTYFSNPSVEPYILGISSGSSLFVGLVMLGGVTFGFQRVTPIFMFIGAFIGAVAIMMIVILAAVRVKNIITLLIVGLMAGYLCSAAVGILSAFAERESLAGFAIWHMGSFAGFTWPHIRIMYAIVCPMLLCSFLMAKPLNALSMGDRYAGSMGINVKATRYGLIFLSSILTAAVTAFAGPVSFIGLAVPHICRIVFRTSDSRVLIPGAILGGAFMASLCDLAARSILPPRELPLGAVTAIIGAPIVVFLLMRKNKA